MGFYLNKVYNTMKSLYIITSLIAFCYARSLEKAVYNIHYYKKINEQHRMRNKIGKFGHPLLGEKLLGEHPGHPVFATPATPYPSHLKELKEVHSFSPHFYEKELRHENSLYHEPQELNHGPVFIPHSNFHRDLEAKYPEFHPHFHEKEYYNGHIHHPQGGLIIPKHAVVPDSAELHPHVFDTNLELMSADGSQTNRSGKSTIRKKSRKRNNKKNKVKKPNKMKNKKLIRMQNNKLKEKKGKTFKIKNDKNKLADKKIMTDDMKLKDAKLMKKDFRMRDARTKDGMKMRDAKMNLKDTKTRDGMKMRDAKMMIKDTKTRDGMKMRDAKMKMKDAIVKDTIAKKDTKN